MYAPPRCSTSVPGSLVSSCTIVALTWCALLTMFISASIRVGKYGAGCDTPITATGLPPMLNDLPTTAESPPNAPDRPAPRACSRIDAISAMLTSSWPMARMTVSAAISQVVLSS